MRLPATTRWQTSTTECFVLEPRHATETYVQWVNDPEVNRFLECRFATQDLVSVKAFVERALEDERVLFLGIQSLELARHVGNIKLGPIDRRHGLGEVGIMIGDRQAWGRGIASRAIGCVADIAKCELGLRKLTASCYASNEASRRAFEKAGFQVEGRRPQHFLLNGRPEDLVLMARMLQ